MKKTRFNWFGPLYTLALSLMLAMLTGINPLVFAFPLAAIALIPMPTASLYSLGYAPYLLRHIKEVALGNTPSEKISSPGYLLMLAEQAAGINVINEGQFRADGTVRDMYIKYRNRPLESDVDDTDNCDINGVPVYKESSVSLNYVAKYAFYLDDTIIAKYMEDAVKTVSVGQPATAMMQEHLGAIFEMLNAFYGKMDTDLVTKQASNFGVNIETGNNNTVSVNINQDGTVNDLTDGLTKILAHYMTNELSGIPYIVGSGLFNNFNLQQFAKTFNQAGIDTSKFLNQYQWFLDRKCATNWGTNQIGVFAPNSVKPLFRNQYVGPFAGKKGESMFFTMTPAVVDVYGNPLTNDLFKLDVQMKYIDCPQDLADQGYAGTYDAKRGYYLIFKKAYDQFNIPSDAHHADDDFYGVNGSLRFTITNT